MIKKTISVSGLTKKQREKDLIKVRAKYEKKGYVFFEYIEDGITKSTAIFNVDESILKKDKKNKIISAVAFIIIISLIIFSPEAKKHPNSIAIENLLKTNKQAKKMFLSTLEDTSNYYVQQKKISETYNKKFYNCLGQMIWDKSENLTINTMLDWCYQDYNKTPKHKMKQYYNTAMLREDFSSWDGSYRPLEKLIKKAMHNPDSYDHVKTTTRMVYSGIKRPYMLVNTSYRGTNTFGAIVTSTVSIKVDAKTKEIFEINQTN